MQEGQQTVPHYIGLGPRFARPRPRFLLPIEHAWKLPLRPPALPPAHYLQHLKLPGVCRPKKSNKTSDRLASSPIQSSSRSTPGAPESSSGLLKSSQQGYPEFSSFVGCHSQRFLLTFINIFGGLRANPTGVTQSSFRLSPTPGWIWSSRSTAGAPDPPQELQIYPWSSRSTPGAPESSSGLLKSSQQGY